MWARHYSQAKNVREIGTKYLEAVKAMKTVSLIEKEKNKLGRQAKAMKLLEEYKVWGGPVTEKSVDTLEELDEY